MSSRYDRRPIIPNSHSSYKTFFKERMVQGIRHHSTPTLFYPGEEELNSFAIKDYIWKTGDRFHKLADSIYGDSRLWWVIPWFNLKPLESDYKYGDLIHLPMPIDLVLQYF